MKKFRVIVEPMAIESMRVSYEWGVAHWGETLAQTWARNMRTAIYSLAHLPERYPLAPENPMFEQDIRHMVIGRYRIIFSVMKNTVHVLYIKGPYLGGRNKD